MTPQPQQQEYIITEMELQKISWNFTNRKLLDSIRSRPAPAPLAMENLTVGAVMAYDAGLKDGAAQAREEVLDALDRDWKGRYVEDAVAEIRRFPESLRTGGEPR